MTTTTQLISPYKPEHPVLGLPTRGQATRLIREQGPEAYNDLMRRRNDSIRREEEDPFHYGYIISVWKLADVLLGLAAWSAFAADPDVPDFWKNDPEIRRVVAEGEAGERLRVLLILGGNRAAKTRYMMWRTIKCAVEHKNARFWIFHQDNANSVTYHQSIVWEYLPHDWKEAGKGKVAYVSYTKKNGFSDNKMVGPNGSEIEFRNYEQDMKSIEGGELGAPDRSPCIGYVADELIPAEWVETLRFRLVTRGATGLIGFTPIEGYTDTVAQFLDGAKTIREEEAPEVRNSRSGLVERVPLLQLNRLIEEGVVRRTGILYFHSKYNPYGNYPELVAECAGNTSEVKKVRLYGVPHKARESRFPRLAEAVHAFDPADLPTEGTRYFMCDPAGRKNWFMAWGLVDVYNRLWIYREWPCPTIRIPNVGHPEPWALPGRDKKHRTGGVPGGGSKSFGFGLDEYKNEIARLEGWEDARADKPIQEWKEHNGATERVKLRWMDSRFAAAPSFSSSGNTTLLEECAGIGLYFEPAPGGNIDEGCDLINDRLSYKEGPPTSGDSGAASWKNPADGPKLFISRECENIWFALKTWTGDGGNSEATKDAVDVVRYFCMADPVYVPDMGGRRRGAGYGQRMSAGWTKAKKGK